MSNCGCQLCVLGLQALSACPPAWPSPSRAHHSSWAVRMKSTSAIRTNLALWATCDADDPRSMEYTSSTLEVPSARGTCSRVRKNLPPLPWVAPHSTCARGNENAL
jgi:hypothetical protein